MAISVIVVTAINMGPMLTTQRTATTESGFQTEVVFIP